MNDAGGLVQFHAQLSSAASLRKANVHEFPVEALFQGSRRFLGTQCSLDRMAAQRKPLDKGRAMVALVGTMTVRCGSFLAGRLFALALLRVPANTERPHVPPNQFNIFQALAFAPRLSHRLP